MQTNMFKFLVLFSIGFIAFVNYCEAFNCDVTPKNTEGRLLKKILCNYDKTVRPTDDLKNATIVKIRLIVKTFDFNDMASELTIDSWLSMKWTDHHLKWTKSEFDNIESITIHEDDIWRPDVTLYNSDRTQYTETCTAANCILFNTGSVSCIPPCTHSAQCRADYKHWPFDIHNCTMTFGSWVHKGEEIGFEYVRATMDENALRNSEWKMLNIKTKKNIGNYSCCPGTTYPSLTYSFVLERYAASEQAYIMGPAIILACLNLLTLWLSPNSIERIVVISITLIGHFLFLQQVSWHAPRNGDTVPNAVLYFRDSLLIAAFLLLQTVLMKGLLGCRQSTPQWVKTTTAYLKNNKAGQLMFSNPYLINGPLSNNSAEEANLVEGQDETTVEERITTAEIKLEESKLWSTAVRILDILLFIILTLIYLTMILAWIPETNGTSKIDAYEVLK